MHSTTTFLARRSLLGVASALLLATAAAAQAPASVTPANAAAPCKPVYLVFDMDTMQSAQMVSLVLQRARVPATFFIHDGSTPKGGILSRNWADWWKARAAEGHDLALQPRDLPVWRGDLPGREPSFRMRTLTGAFAGREFTWTASKYCTHLADVAERIEFYAGQPALPLFHAPQNKTSPRLLQAAQACGYAHVNWPAQYFTGDAAQADALLKRTKEGDVLLSHLGQWAGQGDSGAAALAPLITGLQQQGFCLRPLREHPAYQAVLKSQKP